MQGRLANRPAAHPPNVTVAVDGGIPSARAQAVAEVICRGMRLRRAAVWVS